WLGVGYSLLLIEHTHTISFCFGPCHEPHKNATNRTQDMLNHRHAFPPTGTPYGSVSQRSSIARLFGMTKWIDGDGSEDRYLPLPHILSFRTTVRNLPEVRSFWLVQTDPCCCTYPHYRSQ